MQQNSQWKVGDTLRAPTKDYPNRQFKIISELGSGSEGVIYKTCALKIHFTQLKKDYKEFLYKLISYQDQYESQPQQQQMNLSSFIIRVYDIFELNSKYIVMVMELGTESLYDMIKNQKQNFQTLNTYFIQMIKAVNFLHYNQYIHRDLKSENFMAVGQQIKMIDFGQIKQSVKRFQTTNVGSPLFQAPEILNGSDNYDSAVDIWSLGCVFYEMISSQPLFKCATLQELIAQVNDYRNNKSIIQNKINQLQISEIWKSIILQMLDYQASNRPKIQEILRKIENQTLFNQDNTSSQLNINPNASIIQNKNMSIQQNQNFPIFQNQNVPFQQFPTAPIPQFPNAPIQQFPNAPIQQFPNLPIYQNPNASIQQNPYAPIQQNQNNIFQQISSLIQAFQNQNTQKILKESDQTQSDLQNLIDNTKDLMNQLFPQHTQPQQQQNTLDYSQLNIEDRIDYVDKIITETDKDIKNSQSQHLSKHIELIAQKDIMIKDLQSLEKCQQEMKNLEKNNEQLEEKIKNTEKEIQKFDEEKLKMKNLEYQEKQLKHQYPQFFTNQKPPSSRQTISSQPSVQKKEEEIKQILVQISKYQIDIKKLTSLEQMYQENQEFLIKLQQEYNNLQDREKLVEEQNQKIKLLEFQKQDLIDKINQGANQDQIIQNLQKEIEQLQKELQISMNLKEQIIELKRLIEKYKIQTTYLNNETKELNKISSEKDKIEKDLNSQLQKFQSQQNKTIKQDSDIEEKRKLLEIKKREDAQKIEETFKYLQTEIQSKRQELKEYEQKYSWINDSISQLNKLDEQLKSLKQQENQQVQAKK